MKPSVGIGEDEGNSSDKGEETMLLFLSCFMIVMNDERFHYAFYEVYTWMLCFHIEF